MHQAGTRRSASRIALFGVCLLLAMSVFAWGLHAKLSLYQAEVGTPAASAAKLLLTGKTGRDLVSQQTTSPSPDLSALALSLFSAVLLMPSFRIHWLRQEVVRARAQDTPWSAPRFSRPPPQTSFAG